MCFCFYEQKRKKKSESETLEWSLRPSSPLTELLFVFSREGGIRLVVEDQCSWHVGLDRRSSGWRRLRRENGHWMT